MSACRSRVPMLLLLLFRCPGGKFQTTHNTIYLCCRTVRVVDAVGWLLFAAMLTCNAFSSECRLRAAASQRLIRLWSRCVRSLRGTTEPGQLTWRLPCFVLGARCCSGPGLHPILGLV